MRKGALKNKISKQYKYLDVLLYILFGCTVLLVNRMVSSIYAGEVVDQRLINYKNIKGYVLTDVVGDDLNTMPLIQRSTQGVNGRIFLEKIAVSERKNMMKYIADEKLGIEFIMGASLDAKEIYQLIKSDLIIPLNELIAEYAPNIQRLIDEDTFFKESITQGDGYIYTLPKYYEIRPYKVNQHLFINKEWLKYLGLEIPTTTEEFYEVLKAFKTQDPNGNQKNDEIPFTFIEGDNNGAMRGILGAFGVPEYKEYIMKKDGEYMFVPVQEGYKAGMGYLSRLYQEGLLDSEIFTQDNTSYFSKGRQEEVVLGAFIGYTAEDVVGEERAKAYIPILPLEGPAGHRIWGVRGAERIDKNQFMITSRSNEPEKIIQWIDQFFDPNLAAMYQWGKEDGSEDGEQEITKRGWQERIKTAPGVYTPGYLPKEIYEVEGINSSRERFEILYKLYEPYLHEQFLCLNNATREEIERIVELYEQIDKYVKEMKIRWFPGVGNIEQEWGIYTHVIENMGANEYLALYEAIDKRCTHDNHG